MQRFKPLIKLQPVIIALASLCIMLYAIHLYRHIDEGLKERNSRDDLQAKLILKKSQLEKSLYSRIYYTKAVAAYVAMNPDISTDSYYRLAGEFMEGDSVISTMALSRNCIINAIYPLKGHESALGLNLLEHPKRRQIVDETVRTKKTFVAGPVELIEGGIAFISYTPIFTNRENEESRFWGVTDIVIYRDKLFHEANIQGCAEGISYGIKGYDGKGDKGGFFWGDSTVFGRDPVIVGISLPTGSWVLAATPVIGWPAYIRSSDTVIYLLYAAAIIICILVWLLANAQARIQANAREWLALFSSMEDLIIEFNKKGEYVKIAPTNDSLLLLPKKKMIGRSLYQILDKDLADMHYNAILECLSTKSMVMIDYPLEIKNEKFWFQARISYLSDDAVMFVAQDNSRRKKNEEELRRSEMQLKELNETKDKIFSIIAHDLRSPFNAFLGFTEIMSKELESMSREEVSEIAQSMRKSATSLFRLLEDLLEWSRLQRGVTVFNPSRVQLQPLADECVGNVLEMARFKEINVSNDVTADVMVNCDANMIRTTIRNLLSNAVKFTPRGGSVTITASILTDNRVEVAIMDTGIGIASAMIKDLFILNVNTNRKGTEGEPSTGLGLIICREFIEKHGGSIFAESEVGKGTTFYFTLESAGFG